MALSFKIIIGIPQMPVEPGVYISFALCYFNCVQERLHSLSHNLWVKKCSYCSELYSLHCTCKTRICLIFSFIFANLSLLFLFFPNTFLSY